MKRAIGVAAAIATAACLAGTAMAEVVDVSQTGFLTRSQVVFHATPAAVYAALVRVGAWWDPEHTYSGDGRNLTLEARPGGCFCEKLPGGGGVQHMTVVYASPGQSLRLVGGLGPLQQSGVAASLTWTLTKTEGGTQVEMKYSVGGYFQGGFEPIAPAVDGVLDGQLQRLKRFVETGSPGTK